MRTMQIIKLLGLAGLTYMAASYLSVRAQRRSEEHQRLLNERIEKDRWESEGGASTSGPATQNAIPTH
jgi:hypothetical protein